MKNMKVQAKMLTGFLIVTVIGLLLGIVAIVAIQMIKNGSEESSKLQATSNSASGVLNAHYNWRYSLMSSVMTGDDFTGSLDPSNCALGKWLSSDEAKTITDPLILDMLKEIDSPHRFIHNEASTVVGHIKAGELDDARVALFDTILPKTQEVITKLTEVEARFGALIQEKNQEILNLEDLVTIILIVLIIVAAIISVFLALYISSLFNRPLRALAAFMHKAGTTGDISLDSDDMAIINKYAQMKDEIGQAINGSALFVQHVTHIAKELESLAEGDLSHDIKTLSDSDEMGNSLSQLVNNLNDMFTEIHASTNQVSTGSRQVADGAQSLAQASTEQAASIEVLSNSISEIAERTKENATTADRTAKLSETIKLNAEKGNTQMDEMITAVGEINEASKSISKIIKTIDDIAFQTNILALNAAVEAARAGQHGKGFAVVAEEVRNLASKSAEAAKDTGDMIQNSIEKAEFGARVAGETALSLKEIVTGINESTQLVAEIANSSEHQSLGITQVNNGIDQVAQVVQQNSAIAEESAAASEEMSGQSDMLQQLITQFKLKGSSGMYNSLPSAARPAQRQYSAPKHDDFAYSNSTDFGKY